MTVEQDHAYFCMFIKTDVGREKNISNAISAMPLETVASKKIATIRHVGTSIFQ